MRIGLTGRIASGKSIVAQRFVELGIPVIDADESSRFVVAPGQPGLAELTKRFGAGILTAGGELDRRARVIAARLQLELSPGDRALLVYPAGLEFIAAFFGCMYAGVVAVPATYPKPKRPMAVASSPLAVSANDRIPRASFASKRPSLATAKPGTRKSGFLALDQPGWATKRMTSAPASSAFWISSFRTGKPEL